ncbi:MAG: hypothetical protein ACRC53_03795 [Plesiomonas sp.]|uniref:hypothetical protein n=1 Tax=Plesiomonas sp. TaxID=2486279 RepID=UPI003F3D9B3D
MNLFSETNNVTIDENNNILSFFKKHATLEELIKLNFYNELPNILHTKPHKIKPAYKLKRHGITILEYKVVVGKNDFRAAFIINNNDVSVFYITETTIKREFVNELSKTNLVDH